jgi:hypothetical protein
MAWPPSNGKTESAWREFMCARFGLLKEMPQDTVVGYSASSQQNQIDIALFLGGLPASPQFP